MTYAATIKIADPQNWGAEDLRPWQRAVQGCGFMLHAALDLRMDAAALQAEFAALDASLADDARSFMSQDRSWTSIELIRRSDPGRAGTPNALLDRLPSVRHVIDAAGWQVIDCQFMRLPPQGILPWHFESQAPYLPESRLLTPIHAPAGAVTLIGDETVAYPEGIIWTGDFNFPHQVENRSDEQRIVLMFDVVNTDEVLRLLPPAMIAEPQRRLETARHAVNLLKAG
jgi:hypothetical protein